MSPREFWKESPRRLVAMLEENKKIEKEKMMRLTILMHGGTLDDDEGVAGLDKPATEWAMGGTSEQYKR